MLTAVAVAVKSQAETAGVCAERDFVPTLVMDTRRIDTDRAQAQRLFDYLSSLGRLPARLAFNGYLSEDRLAGSHLVGLVRECLRHGERAANCFACEPVRALHNLNKKVSFEAHRLNGLIRFRILQDGLQYAPIEPDHNVISYCCHHFTARLKNHRWIIHDVTRGLALYWDRQSLQPITVDQAFTDHVVAHGEVPPEEMDEQEQRYQQLWQAFHGAINNSARENRQLQRQLMPKRYWKYLVEMR